jgi:stress responsive alpha/beta barrel protein
MSEKLLRHVVLLQFKDETTEEQIAAVKQAFLAMPAQIAEILQLEWGNAINKDASYSHCLFVTVRNEADLQAYEEHPAHKAVPEQFGHVFAGATVVNYWT